MFLLSSIKPIYPPRTMRTFIVESVYPVDGGALVVAAQQEEVLGVLDLQTQYNNGGVVQNCEARRSTNYFVRPSVDNIKFKSTKYKLNQRGVIEKTK